MKPIIYNIVGNKKDNYNDLVGQKKLYQKLIIQMLKKTQQQQRKKKCKNTQTLYGDSISEIDSKKFYKTRNNYCHHMDELLAYLVSSLDSHLEPLDENNVQRLWADSSQKQAFLKIPNLDPELLIKYNEMVSQKMKKQQSQAKMNFYKYIELIGKLGFILMNDETTSHAQTGFANSAKCIEKFIQLLDHSDLGIKDKIMNLRNYNSKSVIEELENISTTCIHGIGGNFASIYFYHYLKFKKMFPSIQLLPLFLESFNGDIKSPQFLGGKVFTKEIESSQPGQLISNNYFIPEPTTGKFQFYKREQGQLEKSQLMAMYELVSEFDLI